MMNIKNEEVHKFIAGFKLTSTYKAMNYNNITDDIIFAVDADENDFKFADPVINDFFIVWVLSKLDKCEYTFGKGELIVSKGKCLDDNTSIIKISKPDSVGEVGASVNVDEFNPNPRQIDDVILVCKSPEHREKLYNAILDR